MTTISFGDIRYFFKVYKKKIFHRKLFLVKIKTCLKIFPQNCKHIPGSGIRIRIQIQCTIWIHSTGAS